MAASNEWTQWHLTPGGWIRGSYKTDFGGQDRSVPSDCVATWEYSEYLSSHHSKMDVGSYEKWRSPSVTQADVDALLQKHGGCPQRL